MRRTKLIDESDDEEEEQAQGESVVQRHAPNISLHRMAAVTISAVTLPVLITQHCSHHSSDHHSSLHTTLQ